MTVSADAEKLNINTSGIPYKLIIGAALLIDIIGVAVQEMHIFFFYIGIIKKLNVSMSELFEFSKILPQAARPHGGPRRRCCPRWTF